MNRLSREIIDMTPFDAIVKYPIKNSAWYATENGEIMVAEAVDLGMRAFDGYVGMREINSMESAAASGRLRDPWNRVFPEWKSEVIWTGDSELAAWQFVTTIEGISIICKILNA